MYSKNTYKIVSEKIHRYKRLWKSIFFHIQNKLKRSTERQEEQLIVVSQVLFV